MDFPGSQQLFFFFSNYEVIMHSCKCPKNNWQLEYSRFPWSSRQHSRVLPIYINIFEWKKYNYLPFWQYHPVFCICSCFFVQKRLKNLSSNLLWFSYPDIVPFICSLGILEKLAVLYSFLQSKTKPVSSLLRCYNSCLLPGGCLHGSSSSSPQGSMDLWVYRWNC